MALKARAPDDYLEAGSKRQEAGPLNPLATPSLPSEIDDDSFAARPAFASSSTPAPVQRRTEYQHWQSTEPGPFTSAFSDPPSAQKAGALQEGLGNVLVISGGSGYNALVGATPGATHVMPISDDGGSSSEIIRVLGGPSIGDLRSRLVRLIPTSTSHADPVRPPPRSNDALHRLLAYRLPTEGRSRDIKQEWMDILEGRHFLWRGIEPERKECIRGFLVHFESEILRRVHRNFDFRGGSIGNFFLAAAQKFFRSLQSAIFLFSATTLISTMSSGQGGKVLPAINTNHTATIAVQLENSRIIVGQCEISHPATRRNVETAHRSIETHLKKGTPARVESSGIQTPASGTFGPLPTMSITGVKARLAVGHLRDGLEPGTGSESEDGEESDAEDKTKPGGRRRNIVFSKEPREVPSEQPGASQSRTSFVGTLEAPIARLFYVNAYGSEVDPTPNPEYLGALRRAKTLLYSCGSLWTSIVPCIALRGIAAAISTSQTLQYKVVLLNTKADRETQGLDALDFLTVLSRSMQYCDNLESLPLSAIFTHVVYHPHGGIPVDVAKIEALGVRCVPVHLSPSTEYFDEEAVRGALDTIVGDAARLI